MNNNIDPIDYEKLTDDVYYMGGGIHLRLNVILARQRKDGTRRHFISNFKYASKYVDKGKVITMRRSFDYYLTIDCVDDMTQSIMIRIQNMILFKSKLKDATKWFSDSTVYGIKRNKLVILKKVSSTIEGLASGKYITLDPIVIDKEDNTQRPGIRVGLSGSLYTDMSIENFYGLVYLVDTFNMYQSAQLLVASIGVIECDNIIEYNDDIEEGEIPENIKAIDGRKPKNLKKKSFFDKIDEL